MLLSKNLFCSIIVGVVEFSEKHCNSNQTLEQYSVILNLKKVFVTKNHQSFHNNLEQWSFRGIVLTWLDAYLQSRHEPDTVVDIGSFRKGTICFPSGLFYNHCSLSIALTTLPVSVIVLRKFLENDTLSVLRKPIWIGFRSACVELIIGHFD